MQHPATLNAVPGIADLVPGDVLIGNEWHQGEGEPLPSRNPATEEIIAEPRGAAPQQVDAAVSAAREAFDSGAWSRLTPADRRDLLVALADQMEAHREALADIVVADVGTPISLARGLQVGIPIANLRWFAEAAARGPQGGRVRHLGHHFGATNSASLLRREPIGVVAALVAYNYPLYLTVWKIGAALAAGCPVVLAPSPRGAVAVAALAELARRAGFPPGALNFVQGGPPVGDQLARHANVDMLSFTGSDAVGSQVIAASSSTLKKVVLELGGKSPDILLPGVDHRDTVVASSLRFTRNAGQGCGATTRLLVPASVHDDFVEAMVAQLESLSIGDPTYETTDVGPVISREHRDGVLQQVDHARASGAEIYTGGVAPDRPGYYLAPTLAGRIGNAEPLAQDELFAPVAVVIPYDDVDEAVAIANDSRYGLNANVWGPVDRAFAVAERLRTGNVTVNGGGDVRPESPWGGFKRSGLGREMGEDGLAEYFETKHIQWRI